MIDRVTVFGLIASLFGLVFVLELVRRRKLREDYSLLWLATAASLIALTLSRPLLDQIAAFLGIVTYPPAALFLVAIMFMLVILLHYATVLTRLARENKQLAQKMAILQWELEQTRRGSGSPASGKGEASPRGS
ncbi:MAG: DUF2304 domain-containing protein [Anaerolineae bacterium]|nr:DUF2304 domain-containing protein [Anaerolineae bacterium]NUQ06345.1 DUF2304 domain-containing protein [Anaerolineae bacterium]